MTTGTRNSNDKARRVLQWMERGFLLVGLVALGIYVLFFAEARIYQAFGNWYLDRAWSAKPGSATKVRGGILDRKHLAIIPRPTLLFGRLQIPRIGLSVVVRDGDDARTLHLAAGHIPGTALPGQPGNIAIAGHRDTFFRALKDIRLNDTIMLSTPRGSYDYEVESVQVVEPDHTEVLAPSAHPTLTLVTCYPFYFVGHAPKRFIVRAREVPFTLSEARLIVKSKGGKYNASVN